jgi:integrase
VLPIKRVQSPFDVGHPKSKASTIVFHCCPPFKPAASFASSISQPLPVSREARQAAGLPDSLVLYCARHTFGTATYEVTGNLAVIMKVMGHSDVRTAMRYQHPTLDSLPKPSISAIYVTIHVTVN